jgi:hypothetical protein
MPTPQRLPLVNNDDGVWGDIIRQFLMKEHFNDDTDNAINGGHKTITVQAGTATAGTAPLKFTSGTLLTAPEAGAIEFNSDTLYFTQTTSTTRKKIAAYDDSSGATGDIYYRNSGGSFVRLGIGTPGDVLKVSGGLPSWGAASSTTPGGSTGQLQYNNGGSFDGTAGITYASGSSPNATITAQNSAHTALRVRAAASQSVNIQEWTDSTPTTLAAITSDGKFTFGSSAQVNLYRTVTNDVLTTDNRFRALSLTLPNTTPTGVVIYNTSDEVTNTEYGYSQWISDVFTVGTNRAGTGQPRQIKIQSTNASGASTSMTIDSNTVPRLSLTGPNTNSVAGAWYVFAGQTGLSSGVNQFLSVTPTIAQSGTAGYTAIQANVVESTLGSGAKNLLDLQVTGSSKFRVDNTGAVTATGAISGSNLSGTNTGDQVISDATITTTDITTNNVSTSKHGFAPKAPNDASKFLDGTGAWSTASSLLPASTKTTSYTIVGTDVVILANAASGTVTVTLPAASSFTNYRFFVKRIDTSANSCTVTRTGADTIDGQTSITIDTYMSLAVLSNGTNWFIL